MQRICRAGRDALHWTCKSMPAPHAWARPPSWLELSLTVQFLQCASSRMPPRQSSPSRQVTPTCASTPQRDFAACLAPTCISSSTDHAAMFWRRQQHGAGNMCRACRRSRVRFDIRRCWVWILCWRRHSRQVRSIDCGRSCCLEAEAPRRQRGSEAVRPHHCLVMMVSPALHTAGTFVHQQCHCKKCIVNAHGTEQSAGRHIRQCTTYKCVHAGLFVMLSLADNWKYLGARSQARNSLLVSSDCTLLEFWRSLCVGAASDTAARHTHSDGAHATWPPSHIESLLPYRGVVSLPACRRRGPIRGLELDSGTRRGAPASG